MNVKFLNIRIRARALYLAIIISFVSAVYAFLFILSRYYSFIEITSLNTFQRLTDNYVSAINIAMQKESFVEYGQTQNIILFDDSLSMVQVQKKHWGVYNIVSAKANRKNYQINRTALYGCKVGGESSTGLYLADHGHYLAVAGDTYLSGNCYLPKLGARKAYIEGKSFKYRSIVDGIAGKSKENLPPISSSMIDYLTDNLFGSSSSADSTVSEKILNKNTLQNNFTKTTIRVQSEDKIVLDKLSLQGNYIIQSQRKIILKDDCQLQNVICIAPVIIVESGFEGKVQLFALDSVLIENDAVLQYPSAIVAAGIGRSSVYIGVESNSRVEGCIMAYAEIAENSDVQIKIESGSEIYGLIYCAGKTEHKGRIFGSLYCDKFFLQTRQGYYENHLLDAWIDPVGLETSFASGLIFENSDTKQTNHIIEWLE